MPTSPRPPRSEWLSRSRQRSSASSEGPLGSGLELAVLRLAERAEARVELDEPAAHVLEHAPVRPLDAPSVEEERGREPRVDRLPVLVVVVLEEHEVDAREERLEVREDRELGALRIDLEHGDRLDPVRRKRRRRARDLHRLALGGLLRPEPERG